VEEELKQIERTKTFYERRQTRFDPLSASAVKNQMSSDARKYLRIKMLQKFFGRATQLIIQQQQIHEKKVQ
jgi:hypothetical protein